MVLSALNVKDGYIDKSIEAKYGCQELFDKWMGGNSLRKNDVVFTTEAPLGNVAQIPDNNGYILNQRVVAFKTSPNAMDNNFLAQFLRSPLFQNKLNANASGGTAKGISMKEFAKLSLYLPKDINEQRKIGTFLKTMDNTIALHQRKLDALKQMKKGFLQQLFPENGEKLPRVRFTGFQEEWEQRKLGDIGETFAGLSGKTKEDFGHGNAKYVTYMNVFSNPVSNHKMVESVEIDTKQQQVQYGDVFFTTSSETPEEVGMSSVWLGNIKNVYLNSFCFGYRPTAVFAPYYLAFMLRSPILRKKFMLLAQGISRYNISKNKVMDIQVFIPALTEQKKIGACFQQLDNTIALYQYKLDQLNILKKSCLQNMFT
ncbi:restriction endonuclease subunit S [Listeria booriae]|uniref:restriction endonuclease subunit S n=1 Tax=Listeria booriae TaxID=1552123 RepID=UPI0021ADFA1B|nr:restriction endonuclease subunit S [Listeria booriae]